MQVHVGPGALISPQTSRLFSLIHGEYGNDKDKAQEEVF